MRIERSVRDFELKTVRPDICMIPQINNIHIIVRMIPLIKIVRMINCAIPVIKNRWPTSRDNTNFHPIAIVKLQDPKARICNCLFWGTCK